MSDPTKYVPGYSYTGYQTGSPAEPLPADELDNDLAEIAASVDEIVDAVKDVRRSDGKLKNNIVTYDSLSPAMKASFDAGAGGGGTFDPTTADLVTTGVETVLGLNGANELVQIVPANLPDYGGGTGGLTLEDLGALAEKDTILASDIAAGAVITAAVADGAITTAKIADEAVTLGKLAPGVVGTGELAPGLVAIEIVTSLPTTDNYEGRFVYLTTDDLLYKWNGTEWVPFVDIDSLGSEMAAAIDAAISEALITTANFASGITPIEIVATLPTTGNFAGRIAFLTSDNKLYRWTGTAWVAMVDTFAIDTAVTDAIAVQLAEFSLTTANFAAGIVPIEIVATLPTTDNFVGRMALLTSDNKLYRHNGTTWLSSVPASDISGTIGPTQIADDAITTAKIAANAITAAEIAADTITAGQIAAGAISAAEIAAGAITAGKIAANAVSATEILAGAITSGKIAAGAITADKIAANSITSAQIAADTITAGQIAAGAIGASEISAGAIVAGKIAANAISATELQAGSVSASKMSVASLSSISATLGAVDISTATIGTLMVGTSNIPSGSTTDQNVGNTNSTTTVNTSNTTLASVTSSHGAACDGVTLIGVARNLSGTTDLKATVYFTGDAQGVLESYTIDVPPKGLIMLAHLYRFPTGTTSTFNFKMAMDSGSISVGNRKIIAIANKR